MPVNIVRTAEGWWRLHGETASRIDTAATTTGGLLADRDALEGAHGVEVAVGDLDALSPITTPCRVVAQLLNYRSHALDIGADPTTLHPTFFRKSSASISGPNDAIRQPAEVALLDHEIELGIVIGTDIPVGTTVTQDTLSHYAAGVVVGNDVSAREIQLTRVQVYESKSYPTFTPLGPRLVLFDAADWSRLPELHMTLSVNGDVRQDQTIGDDLITPPAEALTRLSRFQSLSAGDVLLTGTPVGTAISAPPKIVQKIGELIPPALKWKFFFARQAKNPRYLAVDDVVTATIRTADGTIDLGTQRTVVR
ncbi:fumarylacetoacetate hydrolase family protein [Rhodococcus sp. BP-349]|uniref:fumarylacetoacetate hydrolase family protein n=1 Tax=unclassified Rhodococcus (in: high G+C Gram-positive bacteria) TaxID=192944 RepID=UPI001C9A57F7|nr:MULTISPECIES: fumarylacetoacetate hydrolase family protein [unclassified Rhodococcus (in: high G+C Gram-positive bacteria)]MBY6538044.1 fumarylacetoacetate hydrolase family protein [Rhodococcus sp. BP-363]MBY6542381.1 fumarylacetoacetate hydrolase family protein [Rhodococcus sp. BP-369]MBY6561611.1 fumarylacetoacetate hydrolase family protein [Rhodococcus sp. BP-370]MBY6575903.1 fumarylacetoacetate hydrolase family protein [Rhodococcus sp. BP-364]MBY6585204.1 fumarylacetoacetate hydrolase f